MSENAATFSDTFQTQPLFRVRVMSKTIYHVHHIIPKHAGGTNDPSNLIKLTIEEHAEAHKILWEQHGKQQDYIAWQALLGNITSEEARIMAVSNALKGVSKSKKQKQKMSISQKKRYEKNGNPNKGRKNPPCSEERKRKISEANKGGTGRINYKHTSHTKNKLKQAAQNRKILTCPKCKKNMVINALKRYHGIEGEKCKN